MVISMQNNYNWAGANPAQRKFVEEKNFGSRAHRQMWNKC